MGDKEKRLVYRTEIQQMMFVSGETAEPSTDTIAVIEQIVQEQVKEVLRRGTEIAHRMGQRAISIDILLLVIRENKAKCDRVRNFLSWKDVRKNVKDNDNDKGDEMALADPADPSNPTNPQEMAARGGGKHRKAKIKLPWDVHTFYAHVIPDRELADDDDPTADPDSDTEMHTTTLQRLKTADDRTRNMTKEEYVHWSECRQASFTFRKGKRFREWAGIGAITDSKPSDDVIDVLGFLTYEIVEWLTENALKIKNHEEKSKGKAQESTGTKRKASVIATTGEGEGGGDGSAGGAEGDEKESKDPGGFSD
ncbi:MAG: hypothetical protein Q9159_006108 [Coniocarpon cinnabarinum]